MTISQHESKELAQRVYGLPAPESEMLEQALGMINEFEQSHEPVKPHWLETLCERIVSSKAYRKIAETYTSWKDNRAREAMRAHLAPMMAGYYARSLISDSETKVSA